MVSRFLSFFLLLVLCASCQFFSSEKPTETQKIEFNKVDVSPSFLACKDDVDDEKTACFRNTIHKHIEENLSKYPLHVQTAIDEVITVNLIISSEGKIALKNIDSSVRILEELPKLDSVLQLSLTDLPKVYPAIKRGIPVTTQYQLPIRIVFKE